MKAVLITSSILIVLVAALRPVLRGRIDPRVQYALWLVAALRLLIPVNFVDSAYSVLALLERTDVPPQIVQAIGQTAIPAMSYEDAYDRAIREHDKISDRYDSLEDWRAIGLSPEEEEMLSARAQELMRGPTVGEIAAGLARPLWLTGAALMAGWFLLVNAGLRRRLRGAKRLNGVHCPLPVYVSDALPSPCLCGALRPAIYVTPAALDDPDRLRHVLAHELTHYRHRDHWWAVLRCLCLCAYWFDPLVWWAAALSRQDCELACDEGAIRALGEAERIPYGRTLVAMIAAGRNPLLQTATTMTGGKRRVRERVKFIARRPKTVIAVALALIVIIACAVGCTFTGAPEDSPEPDPTPSLAPDTPRPTLDTLQERLMTVPEDIEGVTAQTEEGFLASYRLNMGGVEVPLGHVSRWNQVEFEDWLYSLDGAGRYTVFARDSEHYYAIGPAGDSTEYIHVIEDATVPYNAACRAVWDYGKQQVLDTEGVEAFNADELREREYLWDNKTYRDVGYWPYKAVNGSTDVVWIYRMVQLAAQGEGGVWLPERVQHIDAVSGVDPTPYHIKPRETEGMTVTEYAAQLQQEANAGRADWALDPIEAACRYIAGTGDLDSIPLDSFTNDAAYLEEAAAGVGPTEEQQAIQAVMDSIIAADEIYLTLAPAGTSRVYAYSIPSLEEWDATQGYWAYRLSSFATDFRWEKLDAPPEGMNDTSLTIQPKDSPSSIWLRDAFNLVAILTPDGRTEYYQAVSNSYGDPVGTSIWNPNPYGYLRRWFDEVELSRLRTTSVPDRGQSHEDVVNEWIEGFEGAFLKCAPGSMYACTYVQPREVVADAHAWMGAADLESFAQSRGDGRSAEDYGKTWFSFGYNLVFVPENETAKEYLQAGNTADYTGDDAPEGAQVWMRVAYMWLEDGQWVCEGTGTGW